MNLHYIIVEKRIFRIVIK